MKLCERELEECEKNCEELYCGIGQDSFFVRTVAFVTCKRGRAAFLSRLSLPTGLNNLSCQSRGVMEEHCSSI